MCARLTLTGLHVAGLVGSVQKVRVVTCSPTSENMAGLASHPPTVLCVHVHMYIQMEQTQVTLCWKTFVHVGW